MRLLIAVLALCLVPAVACAKPHKPKHPQSVPQMAKLKRDLAELRVELDTIKAAVHPALSGPGVRYLEPGILASLPDLRQPGQPPAVPAPVAEDRHVFPATAIERGQWNDQRRTHRHAGIDLAGACGSPIVASYSGVVLAAPGGDRGYGPLVRVVRGDDGVVYRYAHMRKTRIRPGDRVRVGEQIGEMGSAGGLCHLHFETVPLAEYRRRPYGVHSLDPNVLLGGARGARMAAGEPMTGVTRSAVAHFTDVSPTPKAPK